MWPFALGSRRQRDSATERRLVFVVNGLRTGGTERHVVRLVTGLMQKGTWQISVYCMSRSGQFIQPLEEIGVEVAGPERPWTWSASHVASSLWLLYVYLRRQRPTIVHCYLTLSNVFGAVAARLAGVPFVITSRRGPELFRSRMRELLRYRLPIAIADRCSDVIIAVSEATRQESIREGTPARRLVVIHNSIQIPQRSPRSMPAQDSTLVLGTIARLVPPKGHRYLLEAMPAVVSELPAVRLVVVGDGPERGSLEEAATVLGVEEHVDFLGERQDIESLLATFDIFVLPSFLEGVPNAVLEAMAAGLPVVATRVGGVPEIVEDGINGVLVNPRSPGELAAALIELGRDPNRRAAMSSQALCLAQRFGVQREIDLTEAVYHRITGEPGLVA